MSTEENKATIRRFFEEVWNQGNLTVVDALNDPNFVDQSLRPPVHGLEAIKQFVTMYRAAFPDVHVTLEDLIAEGDKIVIRFTATGTHQGELIGIAPTGRQITVTGINVTRFANGKVVEGWTNTDTTSMREQERIDFHVN
jgi:predicted ester cyclase